MAVIIASMHGKVDKIDEHYRQANQRNYGHLDYIRTPHMLHVLASHEIVTF
jgi:hypothetical protein